MHYSRQSINATIKWGAPFFYKYICGDILDMYFFAVFIARAQTSIFSLKAV